MTARCWCGKVSLRFAEPAPRACFSDGCADCRRFNAWTAAAHGGSPRAAPPLLTHYYFGNDVVAESGRTLLRAFKLTPETQTVRVGAGCCGAWLLGEHPAYGGRVVLAATDSCVVRCERRPPDVEVFMASLPPGVRERLPAWRGPPERSIEGDEAPAALLEKMAGVIALLGGDVALPRQGESIQDILAACGDPDVLA